MFEFGGPGNGAAFFLPVDSRLRTVSPVAFVPVQTHDESHSQPPVAATMSDSVLASSGPSAQAASLLERARQFAGRGAMEDAEVAYTELLATSPAEPEAL